MRMSESITSTGCSASTRKASKPLSLSHDAELAVERVAQPLEHVWLVVDAQDERLLAARRVG